MKQKVFQKFYRISTFLLCGILGLGGCGKSGGGNDSGQIPAAGDLMAYKEMRYLPEFTDTSEKYDAFGSVSAGFVNDTFYLVKGAVSRRDAGSTDTAQLIACNPDTGEEKVVLEDSEMAAAVPLKDGSVIVLSVKSSTEYRLYRVDSGGNEIFSREYSDQALSDGLLNLRLAVDSQDRCYLFVNDSILLYDGQGNASGKVDTGGKLVTQIAAGRSGKVYLYEAYTNQLIPIDFETASLGSAAYTMPVNRVRIITPGSKADFLICDETTVYRYDCGEEALTPLFDLQDSRISNALYIDVMGEMEDGRIFVFSRCQEPGDDATEMALLTPVPLDECPVKEVVTIGTVSPNSNLTEAVADFNRQNEEFNVSIMNYGIGGRSYSEAREAIKLDLSVGKGPDICVLDYFNETESLFSKGYFIDLREYLDGTRKYKREDFVGQALDVYSYGDQLMAIPKYFTLRTIAASSGIVGETAGWNMEDVRAVIREHPDSGIFAEVDASYMLNVCIRNMMEEFVDFDNGKADFDSPGYIELLNFLKELPGSYQENGSAEYASGLQEGGILFSIRDIGRLTDLQVLEADFGGAYTCIGYPAPDRSPDCIILGYEAYAVSANAADKDRAWEFLEWNLSTQGEESYLSRITQIGFPTRADVFENEMKEALEGTDTVQGGMGGRTLSDGTVLKYRRTTPAEIELLRSLIDMASPEKITEQTILGIMNEEAAYLFDGSKTAEEAAEVTQNRVQLYLDEK